ncbi:hypothetical protein, partial [Streptomyces sp. E2N166]|uniref:hypothetical protein n=1 Tax=Streptomyces sp. E2N166 TaxID=1851909 RepID=UPI00187D6BFE
MRRLLLGLGRGRVWLLRLRRRVRLRLPVGGLSGLSRVRLRLRGLGLLPVARLSRIRLLPRGVRAGRGLSVTTGCG